jgi:hypothetical protein
MTNSPTPRPGEGEAATALTDGVMAAQCAWYAYRLGREAGRGAWLRRCMAASLAAVGVAAAAGAVHHGVSPMRRPRLYAASWKVVGLATGAAGTLLLVSSLLASHAAAGRRVWLTAALVKSMVLNVLTWRSRDFRYVLVDYGASMAALFMLQAQQPGPASPDFRRGILLSFLAGFIQQKGPVLHPRFDRNALYHLVQMVALHFFYRAGQRLRDG